MMTSVYDGAANSHYILFNFLFVATIGT